MGTQGNHQTEASGDLEVGVVEGARGANWARSDPGGRFWCCFRTVLVGAAGPIHPGTDVGLPSFAVLSRGNRTHHVFDKGLAPL